MPRVILYIATSLDGYIARTDGGIDWLDQVESAATDYGYADFYRGIDALVRGSKTYEQALAFGAWPYPGKPSYVYTRRPLTTDRNDVIFTALAPREWLTQCSAAGLGTIWLVGGARLLATFQQSRLIDEYVISVVPTLLGSGIPLWAASGPQVNMTCLETRTYPSGLVQLRYRPVLSRS